MNDLIETLKELAAQSESQSSAYGLEDPKLANYYAGEAAAFKIAQGLLETRLGVVRPVLEEVAPVETKEEEL